MTAPVLGIDLGTTNSVVAIADGGKARVLTTSDGDRLIPSVVSFHPSGEVLVGREARERRLLDARNTIYSIKRLIGRPAASAEVQRARERFPFALKEAPNHGVMVEARGETYTLPEISALVLRQVRTVAEEALGTECRRAVITVPANFTELQRSATKAAGRIAGLEVLRILNEPTAAALAYGYGKGGRERIAIYDLGGGTFDVTILELAGEVFEVIATAGDTFLGGDDIDLMIAERMADAFLRLHRFDPRSDAQAFERLRAAAEWAKCQLSTEDEVQVKVEELAYGAGGVSLDLAFGLSRSVLETMVRPLIDRTFEVCEEAMKIAQVRPTQLDEVVLVGGSTRMPLVRAMLTDYFGRPALASIDPDVVVAQGAALQGWALRAASAARRSVAPSLTDALDEPSLTPPSGAAPPPPIPGVVTARAVVVGTPPARDEAPAPVLVPPIREPSAREPSRREPTLKHALPPASPPAAPAPRPFSARSSDAARPHAHLPAAPASASPAEAAPPPLLLDVTPLSLGIETVGGFCEHVIRRNAAIPVEQTRTFTTAADLQDSVRVRVVQGEARKLVENQPLGELQLTGLRRAARGEVQVAVTFVIDADGTLSVRAEDVETGRAQSIRIQLVGGMQESEIQGMAARHRGMFT